MSEAFNGKCKRITYKPANSSKNLVGNRAQLQKPCTLLNEQILPWHSPFPCTQKHEAKARQVVYKLLFYI